MSTDSKFVELTPDVLKIYLFTRTYEYLFIFNISVTAYQFGTVGLCPRLFGSFEGGVADFNSRMLY